MTGKHSCVFQVFGDRSPVARAWGWKIIRVKPQIVYELDRICPTLFDNVGAK